jgi:hypothetical protein
LPWQQKADPALDAFHTGNAAPRTGDRLCYASLTFFLLMFAGEAITLHGL